VSSGAKNPECAKTNFSGSESVAKRGRVGFVRKKQRTHRFMDDPTLPRFGTDSDPLIFALLTKV